MIPQPTNLGEYIFDGRVFGLLVILILLLSISIVTPLTWYTKESSLVLQLLLSP